MYLCGGRGGMSSATGTARGLQFGGSGGGGKSADLLPVQVNRLKSTGDVERLTEHFAEMHGGKNTEFAITVDKNGYATSYTAGGSGSVLPNAKYVDGAQVVHNHPASGWGNFSGADLEYAATTGARGITATSRPTATPKNASAKVAQAYANRRAGTYTFEKGSHFKANDFVKAIHNLKVVDTDYDRTLGNWLVANQRKYGYKYSFTASK